MSEDVLHVHGDKLLFAWRYTVGLKRTTGANKTALHVAAAVLEIVFLRVPLLSF